MDETQLEALDELRDKTREFLSFVNSTVADTALAGLDVNGEDPYLDLAVECENSIAWANSKISEAEDELAEEDPIDRMDDAGHNEGDF